MLVCLAHLGHYLLIYSSESCPSMIAGVLLGASYV